MKRLPLLALLFLLESPSGQEGVAGETTGYASPPAQMGVPSGPAGGVDGSPQVASVIPSARPLKEMVDPPPNPTVAPTPTLQPATVGYASWLHGPAGRAHAPWGYWRMPPTPVRVWLYGNRERFVDVLVVGYCQCYVGTAQERLIDLARSDFALLADPAEGTVRVELVIPEHPDDARMRSEARDDGAYR